MKDYPSLLDEHLTEILTPLESEKKLSYEDFSQVAKVVFEKQLARFTGSIWTRVALIFYLVKEVLYSGTLTDIQVELVVEYASRFITETSADKIKKEGGWVSVSQLFFISLISSSSLCTKWVIRYLSIFHMRKIFIQLLK